MTRRPKTMSPDGYSQGEAALSETLRRILMSQAFPGQTGVGVLTMLDKDGRETDNWDKSGGVLYETTNADVAMVVDDDLNPKDARVEARAIGTATLSATFDARIGEEVVPRKFEAIVDVVEPPPGEVVSGTFKVVWQQVPTS